MENVCAGIERVEERLWVEIGCGMQVERGCGRRSCGEKRLQVERGVAGGEREVVGGERLQVERGYGVFHTVARARGGERPHRGITGGGFAPPGAPPRLH